MEQMQRTPELASRDNEMPAYQAPVVVSYDEDAVWQMLGPAQTSASSTFGRP
jgi:hypothetical protein